MPLLYNGIWIIPIKNELREIRTLLAHSIYFAHWGLGIYTFLWSSEPSRLRRNPDDNLFTILKSNDNDALQVFMLILLYRHIRSQVYNNHLSVLIMNININTLRFLPDFNFIFNSKGRTTTVWCNISFVNDLYVNCAAPPLSAYDIFMSLRYTRGNRWNWWLFCNFIPFYCRYNVLVRGMKYATNSDAYGIYKIKNRY